MKHLIFICTFIVSLSVFTQEEPKLTFEPAGGKYNGPVNVKLSAGEGARIYYTTDGTTPTSASRSYSSEITVQSVAVIRAVAYVGGRKTDVITQSYFCDRAYSLPIISIATEPGNLWDPATGIYVAGCCADTIPPYMGANYHKDWEREANIEMYDVEGKQCFNQRAGIKIFGGFSRMLPQKSLAVIARDKYGKDKFEYPIFPGRPHKKYKAFVIRNSGGDFNITHLRDAFMTQLAKPTGVAIQEYQPAIVFINGQYWGIQNLREKTNEHYLKQNYGVDKDNVDILRHNGSTRYGYSKEYKRLLAYLRTNDMTRDETIKELNTFMDIEDFIRYNIAEVYSDNRDAGGNIKYWKERNDSARWRWILYDLDLGLGNSKPLGYKHNTVQKFTSVNNEVWPDPPWSTFIIRSLLANEGVKNQYINTFADHLNTVYHPDTALRLFERMQETIRPEMPNHLRRWNSSMKAWEINLNVVRKFIKLRPYYLRQFVMEKFEIKDTLNIKIDYPEGDIADIKFNSLDIKRDFEGIYFKSVPVKIVVTPKHDYELVGWEGRKEKTNEIIVTPERDLVLKPIIQPKKRSIYADSIIVNEISFYQPGADTTEDWVEFYNRSSNEIDLKGWGFTDAGFKNRFIIPGEIKIGAGEYLVLCENRVNFVAKYGEDSIQSVGDLRFGLSKNGEKLRLYDNEGFIVDSLTYIGIEDELIDTNFTLALVHPDSIAFKSTSLIRESPSPGEENQAYKDYLKREADKRYWTKVYYIGGGSFFFILVAGLLFYRSYKKKKRARMNNAS